MSLSSGWANVTTEHLRKLGRYDALEFVQEMFNYGGRIGVDGYRYWVAWIEANL